jgi:DNA repair protein RadC
MRVNRVTANRLHGKRCNELGGRPRHHHPHIGASVPQPAHKLGTLISSDAPGYPEHDAFIGKCTHMVEFTWRLVLYTNRRKGADMSIVDWPAAERPREKLLQRGAESLSDAELLAIFLRTGVTGKTAVDLSRELLARFGGLRALLAASQTEFCAAPGLGGAKYAQLQAVLEMGRRQLEEGLRRGVTLSSPKDVEMYLHARLGDRKQEVFCCLFLDNCHRVLAFEELFYGTINGTAVYAREIVRRGLFHNAAAVILVHNHPSGVAEPSRADEALTMGLKQALALVDIRVLDHMVIGDREVVSFSERGIL